jgi:retinol dehydrogenase-12
LSSLRNIAAFCEDIDNSTDRIDWLILNAGVMMVPTRTETEDGFETQIGVNHFGHYRLTNLLLWKLETQNIRSRIVILASKAHSYGSVDIADLHFNRGRKYSGIEAYGQSKTANILFAKSLADKMAVGEASLSAKITALSVHPGVIATNLTRHIITDKNSFTHSAFKAFITDKTIGQGAATTLYACLAPELEEHGGAYLSDCTIANDKLTSEALDKDCRKRVALWDITEQQIQGALVKGGSGEGDKSCIDC